MLTSVNRNPKLSKILSSVKEVGISTGITALDEAIGGYVNGKLITIAAVSGTGKTSIMADGIIAASEIVPVGVISIEMGLQVVERIVYNIADVNFSRKNLSKSEQQRIEEAKKEWLNHKEVYFLEDVDCMYPQYILDTKKPTDSIEVDIAEAVNKGVRILFLDYIQMVRWGFKSESETLRLKEITNKLHNLALEYNIPIVILCQLTKEAANRVTKKDADPTPTISDIRDGGFIVNDSDVILLLHRPNMIKHSKEELSLLGDVIEDAQIIVGKNRNGVTGTINTEFRCFSMRWRTRKKNLDELF